jgi:hypothetical protein
MTTLQEFGCELCGLATTNLILLVRDSMFTLSTCLPFPRVSENLLSICLKFLASSFSEIEVRHVWRIVFVEN